MDSVPTVPGNQFAASFHDLHRTHQRVESVSVAHLVGLVRNGNGGSNDVLRRLCRVQRIARQNALVLEVQLQQGFHDAILLEQRPLRPCTRARYSWSVPQLWSWRMSSAPTPELTHSIQRSCEFSIQKEGLFGTSSLHV